MANSMSKQLTPFGEAALALDSDFAELERLSAEIEKHTFQSDSDMERAQKLFSHFSDCGQRIAGRVQVLAKALETARANAEGAAHRVSQQASLAEMRQKKTDSFLARFQALGESARVLTEMMAKTMTRPDGGELTEEERTLMVGHLPSLCHQLDKLITEGLRLREDTHGLNMRGLERDAHALTQSLQAVRRRLDTLVEIPAVV